MVSSVTKHELGKLKHACASYTHALNKMQDPKNLEQDCHVRYEEPAEGEGNGGPEQHPPVAENEGGDLVRKTERRLTKEVA
jgi:hypothetical protein